MEVASRAGGAGERRGRRRWREREREGRAIALFLLD
jgi:hypothetical protein